MRHKAIPSLGESSCYLACIAAILCACGNRSVLEEAADAAVAPALGPAPVVKREADAGSQPSMIQGYSPNDYYVDRCGGCHGTFRQGGIGPALTPKRLDKAKSFYAETIRDGRSNTLMPQWGDKLNDREIRAVAEEQVQRTVHVVVEARDRGRLRAGACARALGQHGQPDARHGTRGPRLCRDRR